MNDIDSTPEAAQVLAVVLDATESRLLGCLIEKEAKAADVRKELLDARASADAARTITNTIPQGGPSAPAQPGALKANMLKMIGKGN